MGTIKKFWIYFILFILFFLWVTFMVKFLMMDRYVNISNYEIKTQSPEITVDEFKVEYSHGYIKGSVKNNTGDHIPLKYLRIDLYNKDKKYAGTEYKELKYFNVDETINYDINFKYDNVDKCILSIVDKKEETRVKKLLNKIDWKDESIKIGVPIAGLLILQTILP